MCLYLIIYIFQKIKRYLSFKRNENLNIFWKIVSTLRWISFFFHFWIYCYLILFDLHIYKFNIYIFLKYVIYFNFFQINNLISKYWWNIITFFFFLLVIYIFNVEVSLYIYIYMFCNVTLLKFWIILKTNYLRLVYIYYYKKFAKGCYIKLINI